MDKQQIITAIEDIRTELSIKVGEISTMITLLERGAGAPELTLAKRKIQEATHWVAESLNEITAQRGGTHRDA